MFKRFSGAARCSPLRTKSRVRCTVGCTEATEEEAAETQSELAWIVPPSGGSARVQASWVLGWTQMALRPVDPFTRAIYGERTGAFIEWATDYVEATAVDGCTGWRAHFLRYDWQGDDWAAGLHAREEMARSLAEARSVDELISAAQGIAAWGRMKDLSTDEAKVIVAAFAVLDALAEGGDWHQLHAGRIATSSKVYAMHDQDRWAIFDSRVGFALASLVDRFWAETGERAVPGLLGIPVPPGRVLRRLPDGFAQVATRRQAQLGFVYSSWLLRAIAESLDGSRVAPEGNRWRLRHVEMACFMLGSPAAEWPDKADDASIQQNRLDGHRMATGGSKAAVAGIAVAGKVASVLEDSGLDFLQDQIDVIWARERAIRFAAETGSVARELQFADGKRRWVLVKDGVPIASFPEIEEGTLEEALRHHDLDELGLEDAKALREGGRLSRLAVWGRRKVDDRRKSKQTKRVQELERFLDYEKPTKRRDAATAMGEERHGDGAGALIAALHDSNSEVRAAAARSLGVLGTARADDPLARLLSDRELEVRIDAAVALGTVRGSNSLAPLIALLDDASAAPQLRAAAGIGLAALGDAAALDSLVRAVELRSEARTRDELEVPAQAALALGLLGHEVALPTLVDALSDDAPTLRVAAATGIGFLGSPKGEEPLDGALMDSEKNVIKAAYTGLAMLAAERRPDSD